MKRLILIRHAESLWPENTEDFYRPLAEKGVKEAKKMSAFLKNNGFKIDQFVSSPALRTLSTCEIFNEIYKSEIRTNLKLYNPKEADFLSVIYDLDDEKENIVLCSHNNGISNFANLFSEEMFHFPTCGVAVFDVDCRQWSEFESAKKKLAFFYNPKRI